MFVATSDLDDVLVDLGELFVRIIVVIYRGRERLAHLAQ